MYVHCIVSEPPWRKILLWAFVHFLFFLQCNWLQLATKFALFSKQCEISFDLKFGVVELTDRPLFDRLQPSSVCLCPLISLLWIKLPCFSLFTASTIRLVSYFWYLIGSGTIEGIVLNSFVPFSEIASDPQTSFVAGQVAPPLSSPQVVASNPINQVWLLFSDAWKHTLLFWKQKKHVRWKLWFSDMEEFFLGN